jgi:tRNA-2-methylthio-N6-dimethylallyladenosine synthase
VLDRSALRKSEARVGREEEVLVEGPSKRDPLMTSARTKQNKLIHFAYRDANGEQRALPAGTFCNVLVTGAAPYFLRGDLLEVTAKPRHRKRIPVSAVER